MTYLTKGDETDVWLTERGCWRRVQSEGVPTANASCPKCGLSASLSDHDIAENGQVSPSLVCPGETCDFHDNVTLVGWGK